MTKTAISVTLEAENLVWLKGKANAAGLRSVSELLDRLISDARGAGVGPSRSVVGTIDIAADDPDLEHADETVRALFARSIERPLLVREGAPEYGLTDRPQKGSRRKSGRRRG